MKSTPFPFHPFSLLALALPAILSADSVTIVPKAEEVELQFTTTSGKLYSVEESTDLNSWTVADGFPAIAEGDSESIPIEVSGNEPRFFRVSEMDGPLPLLNRQSGISVALSGTNGEDWLVEHSYHDAALTDQVIYLRSDVEISLFHNANNSIMNRTVGLPAILGDTGLDGIPNNGDEGDIHWKIDRDMQNHSYNNTTSIPSWAPLYSAPFRFDGLTYDGSLPVLGTTGDNGKPWGDSPKATTERFAYGQVDATGNEWHTLTYWDDDEPVYDAAGKNSHRQGASDGHWVYVCVNPVTPVVQFVATGPAEQFYTTPIKTYHVPKTWAQTTYLTGGVELRFFNLNSDQTIEYRVDEGNWQPYSGNGLLASDLVGADDTPVTLEFRNGPTGPVAQRTLVLNPGTPAADEVHGYLLWADAEERDVVVNRLKNVQPFKQSYIGLKGSYYQDLSTEYDDVRGGWRSGAGMASTSLNNAFLASIDGLLSGAAAADIAKERLLRMARLEPVGFERDINSATPSKDYLNELSQTIQQFADAAVAYDLLAANFRQSDEPDGMSPIEEIRIRDGLAEIAKTILQVRANNSFSVGGGDTHWAHGYELAIGIIAAAMPTYKTPYFGVSGGDFETVNDLIDENDQYWNPFPDQGVTWWDAATDPFIETPGHPNVKAPLRAEALLTDNGYWTGPNDFQGDGDRYFTGPVSRRLVDIPSLGMANAECRVELVEMAGYEAPFVSRLHALDFIRRIRGDDTRQNSVTQYIRRRLMQGYVPLSWDSGEKIYQAQAPRAIGSVFAYNNHYEAASLPSTTAIMGQLFTDLNRYYGFEAGTAPSYISDDRKSFYDAYALALCWAPDTIGEHQTEPNHAPIIKPLLKHVVKPGERIFKELLIMDPDDDAITISVTDLPGDASYNESTRTIEWTPTVSDEGVHVATVTVNDGSVTTTTHFPMIVKSNAPAGPVPSGPANATAALNGNDATITWSAPGGVTVSHYIVWRDGIPAVVIPAGTTSWTDFDLPARTHTRYHVSLLATTGAESGATVAAPGYLAVE